MNKEQVAHDLALLVVKRGLEQEQVSGIDELSKEAVEIYKEAVRVIKSELD